jgi:putative transposase
VGLQPPGYPQFKKKDLKDSFALREATKFDVEGRVLRIEKLPTRIKLRQKLRFTGQTKQVTISKAAGRFYVSLLSRPRTTTRTPRISGPLAWTLA